MPWAEFCPTSTSISAITAHSSLFRRRGRHRPNRGCQRPFQHSQALTCSARTASRSAVEDGGDSPPTEGPRLSLLCAFLVVSRAAFSLQMQHNYSSSSTSSPSSLLIVGRRKAARTPRNHSSSHRGLAQRRQVLTVNRTSCPRGPAQRNQVIPIFSASSWTGAKQPGLHGANGKTACRYQGYGMRTPRTQGKYNPLPRRAGG